MYIFAVCNFYLFGYSRFTTYCIRLRINKHVCLSVCLSGIISACTQSHIRRKDWKKVCMISGKLYEFWPASLRQQVTNVWVIREECFVARRRQRAMSCGKKSNLPCCLKNVYDDS